MDIFTILTDLGKLSPILLIMGTWLYNTLKKVDAKDLEIINLNNQIKENNKENLNTLNMVNNTLTNIIKANTDSTDDILEELKDIKNIITK